MATSYPSGIDNFTNPSANDYEDVVSHSGQHSNANDAIEAIETTLGTTAGTAVLKNLSAGDFAAKTANETFSGTTSFAEIDIGSSTVVDEVLDEDDMASDSATALVTQQSVKAYSDTKVGSMYVGSFTHDVTTTGSQAITGVGFQPRAIIAFTVGSGGTTNTISSATSQGSCDENLNQNCIYTRSNGTVSGPNSSRMVYMYDGTGHTAEFAVTSLDADGFTGTWSNIGSPTGTANVMFICFG